MIKGMIEGTEDIGSCGDVERELNARISGAFIRAVRKVIDDLEAQGVPVNLETLVQSFACVTASHLVDSAPDRIGLVVTIFSDNLRGARAILDAERRGAH